MLFSFNQSLDQHQYNNMWLRTGEDSSSRDENIAWIGLTISTVLGVNACEKCEEEERDLVGVHCNVLLNCQVLATGIESYGPIILLLYYHDFL